LEPQGFSGLPVKRPRRYKGRFYRNFTASTMEQNEKSWYCLGYPEQYQLFVVLWKRIRLG
ncbi:hypothetical protein, partial [Pseudoflavonifractor phocaeensis]|uniref:hypothetical protein n=1 Tax=Pseudoflavonifractor phocaeensis TaxID=1870988 RepID=UPI001959D4C8